MGDDNGRNTLILVGVAFVAGVIVGLILVPRGRGSHEAKNNRTTSNLVFGNIIIGSNNGERSSMEFGQNDDSENR
ncbi:MAG: hypothetical protein AAF787_03585 [Chloroflexota bacterium]